MRRSGFASAVACAWLLGGCGPGFVHGDYPGEELFRIEGLVRYDESRPVPDTIVGTTVLWKDAGSEGTQTSNGRVETTFPARYSLSFFTPPDPEVVQVAEDMTVGAVVLFHDDNDDGVRQEDEPLVGGSPGAALMYTWRTLGESEDSGSPLFEPGYYVIIWEVGACERPASGHMHVLDPMLFDLYLGTDDFVHFGGCGGD
jgi:hypothetical protein